MSGARDAARVALAILALSALPASASAAEPPTVPSTTLFRFHGDDVFESSGLVDRGRVVYTNNDSGDDAVVYGFDPRSGRLVSRSTYAGSATDVEAIAPGADGTVWAGDTGDNRTNRDSVQVYRLDPRRSEQSAPRYDLVYPDGPHDAETLLVQPRTQRVFVVTKTAFGGTVYAAPRRLSTEGSNRLRRFARVGGLVTDGSFFPDGRHVVLRTYSAATVYRFPGFVPTGTVTLPAQQQGEAISVSRTGRVLLSSEGVRAPVLRVRLPARLSTARAPVDRSGSGPSTSGSPPVSDARRGPRSTGDWVAIAGFGAGLAGLVWLVVRSVPRHGRRRQ